LTATPVRPPALPPGATLALIAPAAPYDAGEFQGGRQRLKSLGFRVRHADGHRRPGALVAGTVAARLEELHGAFADPEVDGIIAIRGGYGVMQLLDRIDWDLLARNPKPLVGLSDLTPLLNAALDRAGLISLHGPMVVGLGGRTDGASVDRLMSALTHSEPLPSMRCTGDAGPGCIQPGRAEGRLVGGNLAMVAATAGTPFQLRGRGRVVLLEEVGEPPYRIDRMLTQLRLAGLLDGCAALGFGEMVGCEPAEGVGYSLRDVVRDAVADLTVPVLWGLPFGHGTRNWTFPVGVRARVDAEEGEIRFLESAVNGAQG